MKPRIKIALYGMILLGILILAGVLIFNGSRKYVKDPRYSQIQELSACADHAPYGWPQLIKPQTVVKCRTAYALMHDNDAKIAPWVVYTLTPEATLGCFPRSNSFMADPTLPKDSRAEVSDYVRSGYDMGHIANHADMSWNEKVEKESFYLSNIAPQIAKLNRGPWRILETDIRNWAYDLNNSYTIYSGSIYNNLANSRIGANQIIVPNSYYKIVINNSTRSYAGWVMPNRSDISSDINIFLVGIKEIERLTSIQFPIPSNFIELNTNTLWIHANGTAFNNRKRIKCKS